MTYRMWCPGQRTICLPKPVTSLGCSLAQGSTVGRWVFEAPSFTNTLVHNMTHLLFALSYSTLCLYYSCGQIRTVAHVERQRPLRMRHRADKSLYHGLPIL